MGTEIVHIHPLALGAFHQTPQGGIVKNNFKAVFFAEGLRELAGRGLQHFSFMFLALGHETIEDAFWFAHQLGRDPQLTQT